MDTCSRVVLLHGGAELLVQIIHVVIARQFRRWTFLNEDWHTVAIKEDPAPASHVQSLQRVCYYFGRLLNDGWHQSRQSLCVADSFVSCLYFRISFLDNLLEDGVFRAHLVGHTISETASELG